MSRNRRQYSRKQVPSVVYKATSEDRTFEVTNFEGLHCVKITEPGHPDYVVGPFASMGKAVSALKTHLSQTEPEGGNC